MAALRCPHCGNSFVPKKPLAQRSGPATKFVLEYLGMLPRGQIVKASDVTRIDLSTRHINNAFCYLNSRGLVERVRYGHYRIV